MVFGKDPRSAMAVKISGNFMIASAIESMGESVALVKKRLGVEPGRFMELMSSTLSMRLSIATTARRSSSSVSPRPGSAWSSG